MLKLVCSKCRDVVNVHTLFSEKVVLSYYNENINDKIFVKEPNHVNRIQFNNLTCRLCKGTEFKIYMKKYE